MISPSQRPLPDNTEHSQQTNIHAPGGIRTHDRSRRAAVDLPPRLRGQWDRLFTNTWSTISQKRFTLHRQRRGNVESLHPRGCSQGHTNLQLKINPLCYFKELLVNRVKGGRIFYSHGDCSRMLVYIPTWRTCTGNKIHLEIKISILSGRKL